MSELDVLEHRVKRLEGDVRLLGDKINSFAVSQAAANTKLDSLLVTLGELKESVAGLRGRPAQLWDKLIFSALGALAAGVAAAVLNLVINKYT